jgi:hypothetical protein
VRGKQPSHDLLVWITSVALNIARPAICGSLVLDGVVLQLVPRRVTISQIAADTMWSGVQG